MDDLISRQKAIDTMNALPKWPDAVSEVCLDYSDVISAIEGMPSTQQWIPCSERLPERNGYYLVTGRKGAVNKRLYQDGYWYGNWAIIAWMPLPEPWRGENNET